MLWSSAFFEQLAIDLAAVVFRKRRNEFNPARVFVGGELRLNKFFQLFGELITANIRRALPSGRAIALGLAQYHKGLRFNEPVTRIVTDNCAFKHRLMLKQAVLNFSRRNEDA